MNSILAQGMAIGLYHYTAMKSNNEDWKERLRREWQESKNLPRKQKKAKRKELELDWQIASWDPFDFNF